MSKGNVQEKAKSWLKLAVTAQGRNPLGASRACTLVTSP